MKIDPKVLPQLNNVKNRIKIAYASNVSEQAVKAAILNNSSVLTKHDALNAIKEITGLNETELLIAD